MTIYTSLGTRFHTRKQPGEGCLCYLFISGPVAGTSRATRDAARAGVGKSRLAQISRSGRSATHSGGNDGWPGRFVMTGPWLLSSAAVCRRPREQPFLARPSPTLIKRASHQSRAPKDACRKNESRPDKRSQAPPAMAAANGFN